MALSPMMQHYIETKEKYADCILFYRLGDFYEMFFDDAVKVSSLLDLTLTGKDCGLPERAPMCGIPFHAADVYISKLVEKGEKVAICEQLTEPNGKNLVERDVIKIVTAGTVTDSELIDEKKNNFIGSVYILKDSCSFSYADITTGEFFTRSFEGQDYLSKLCDILTSVSPAEIIGNGACRDILNNSPFVIRGFLPKVQDFLESEFEINNAYSTLLNQFKLNSLSKFNLSNQDICVSSAGALISYITQTQKRALSNLNGIKKENNFDTMMLDVNAVRNLELVKNLHENKTYGSLLWLLDKTKTSMGARKLAQIVLSPLLDVDKINYRLCGVETFFLNTTLRVELSELLSCVKDIGRISGKISNGNLTPKDCIALKNSLAVLPNVKFRLLGENANIITDLVKNIADFSSLYSLLNNAISDDAPAVLKDGGYIKAGFSPELDELRDFNKNGRSKVAELEARERSRTGIKTLKVAFNRVFGYYIEVTNSFKELVPLDYIRRQTIANAERYVTEELKDLENKILSSEDKSLRLENSIFNDIKNQLGDRIEDLKNTAESIATLDVLLSLATVARENNYVKPIMLNKGEELNIVDGRHPVVESISKNKFIPNDCLLDSGENRTMILTGPNMAGKSTYMRQVALIVLMAHIGSFVPAKSAKIPLTDKIFTRIGASDNLILDQSTFMVEMNEVAYILDNATENSLLVLDEIGRGTSTFDGLSIAWAIVEYVTTTIKAKTLFATHYHELTELEGKLEGVKNFKVTVKEMQDTIIFLRKIMRGGANRSFGIEVANLAGVNKEVTEKAKKILKTLENNSIKTESNAVENKKEIKLSNVEKIISELDMNKLSPMDAFNILIDLHEKVDLDEQD